MSGRGCLAYGKGGEKKMALKKKKFLAQRDAGRMDGQREPRGHKNCVLFDPDTLRQIALKFVCVCVVIHAKVLFYLLKTE